MSVRFRVDETTTVDITTPAATPVPTVPTEATTKPTSATTVTPPTTADSTTPTPGGTPAPTVSTTTMPPTTVTTATPYVVAPCLKMTKDEGVFKKEEVSAKLRTHKRKSGSVQNTMIVKLKSVKESEPEWSSITFKVSNVKTISVTPRDKHHHKFETVKVPGSTTEKEVVVTFKTPVKASHMVVHFTEADKTKPVVAEVASLKACAEKTTISKAT